MNNIVTMDEAKKLASKNLAEAVGTQFEAPTGATGTVIAELSSRGKVQAELTCTEQGCTETHVREISDWHQCGKCRTHKKSKSRGGGGAGVSLGDGNVMREVKILDTDPPEVRELKESINAEVRQLKEVEAAERKAAQEKAAAERKQKQEAERAQKEAERLEAQKKALAARKEQIARIAAEKGVKVSPRTEAEIAEAEAEVESA